MLDSVSFKKLAGLKNVNFILGLALQNKKKNRKNDPNLYQIHKEEYFG